LSGVARLLRRPHHLADEALGPSASAVADAAWPNANLVVEPAHRRVRI
jgi:hypothetical protein